MRLCEAAAVLAAVCAGASGAEPAKPTVAELRAAMAVSEAAVAEQEKLLRDTETAAQAQEARGDKAGAAKTRQRIPAIEAQIKWKRKGVAQQKERLAAALAVENPKAALEMECTEAQAAVESAKATLAAAEARLSAAKERLRALEQKPPDAEPK
jgi:chromosome segregation ATPase